MEFSFPVALLPGPTCDEIPVPQVLSLQSNLKEVPPPPAEATMGRASGARRGTGPGRGAEAARGDLRGWEVSLGNSWRSGIFAPQPVHLTEGQREFITLEECPYEDIALFIGRKG